MRDKRFIAEHRGGPLQEEQHYRLMNLACRYAEHVLASVSKDVDERLYRALRVAIDWTKGNATVGDARKASLGAIAFAHESTNLTDIAVARAVGHAVATAHMADHSLGAAYYALKAAKSAGKSVEEERKWQDEQLPEELRELFLSARILRKV